MSPLDLDALLGRPIEFAHTGDGEHPFIAVVDGATLLVRVNDFPAEPLYSLLAGGAHLADLEDWPAAWMKPPIPANLRDLVARTPRGAALLAVTSPMDPAALHAWARTMCATEAADSETVLRVLRFDGALIDGVGGRRIEPPPAHTARASVSETRGELFTLQLTPGPVPITRGALDAEFGEGHELVRVHWDSDHRVMYPVTIEGAPFTCDVTASFRTQPTSDAIAIEVTLRRQRAR